MCAKSRDFDIAGETRKLPVRGMFYGIGHKPNSGIVAGQIDLDEMGYAKVSTSHCIFFMLYYMC